MSTFKQQVERMNVMYGLPALSLVTIPPDELLFTRLHQFHKMIRNEADEAFLVIEGVDAGASKLDTAVALADLLGDIIVYARSEALKYGIPLEEVLTIIMESNFSKLGADGKPIVVDGKIQKGPNYWKPEPRIRELLKERMYNGSE
jgi:predicted HAD superfamily Cof-like phosphohydrolase